MALAKRIISFGVSLGLAGILLAGCGEKPSDANIKNEILSNSRVMKAYLSQGGEPTKWKIYRVDLDGDGDKEILAFANVSNGSQKLSSWYLLEQRGEKARLIEGKPMARNPFESVSIIKKGSKKIIRVEIAEEKTRDYTYWGDQGIKY